MTIKFITTTLVMLSTLIYACTISNPYSNEALPILGRQKILKKEVNNRIEYDTVNHTIDQFSFLNQDSILINNDSLIGNVYVADFFFTSCPTICPVMKKQLLRVYDSYSKVEDFKIVSHTIDPVHDNVSVLRNYAEALGISSHSWHFLTGDKETIYELGEKSYMVTSGEDKDAPGGYIHSGAFLLVDRKQQIRGVYDGTDPEKVDLLMQDITNLINE